MEKKNKFYITTAIAYTNAPPHLGHALEFVQTDVLARYHRLLGHDTYFLTGTDEHGSTVARAAKNARINPQEFVDELVKKFKSLDAALDVQYDQFIRTTDRTIHWPAVEKLWRALVASGDVYKKEYEGLYCVGHEAFIKKTELEDGLCPLHKAAPEVVREENWFFRLTKYKDRVREKIESGELNIVPAHRKQEILNLIDDAEDVSFSRPQETLEWGIPVPDDPTQTIYVWADALTNYISALGYGTPRSDLGGKRSDLFSHFWPADVHLIGKDILRFHALYWPAMLLAVGVPLPRAIYVHGFITIEGQKMSKTVGNVIDPFMLVEKYGSDVVRYFLLREIPSGDDGDFSYKNLEARYNADLANGLGNFISRVTTMADGLAFGSDMTLSPAIEQAIIHTKEKMREAIDTFRLNDALAVLWELISFGDTYVNEKKPWETKDRQILFDLTVLADNVGALVAPFMPRTSAKIQECIRWDEQGLRARKSAGLFPRLAA
ncbi:MAG: methionine--tRNA ligase [Patescibacteria group bacterium]